MTVRIKEITQLDVYIFRKMVRNHGIMNLIRRPYKKTVSSTHNRLSENFLNYCLPKKDIRFLGGNSNTERNRTWLEEAAASFFGFGRSL